MADGRDIETIDLGFERLPIPCLPGNEDALSEAVYQALAEAGVPKSVMKDEIAVIAEDIALFAMGATNVQPITRKVIAAGANAGLGASFSDEAMRLGRNYLDLLSAMREEWKMNPATAFSLISESGLVLRLAIELRMSSAGIAEMLGARGQASRWPWQAIQSLLKSCGHELSLGPPEISEDHPVRLLWEAEGQEVDEAFADAGLEEAIAIVARHAAELGMHDDVASLLATFFNNQDGEPQHEPYLQVLHFQMVIAEFFDHPLTNAYEFNPRGKICEWVTSKYNSESANPYLNNLKGVERLDATWAWQRKPKHRPMAISLASILEAASEMPYQPRRRFAKIVRLFLMKTLQLRKPASRIEMTVDSTDLARKTVEWVSAGPTHTLGIVEQRFLDWICIIAHPKEGGWRARGIGASINATNVSSGRLGDCDFQNQRNTLIEAYEATAGTISRPYVEHHLATLRKSLRARAEELRGVADLGDWKIRLVFVCHSIGSDVIGAHPGLIEVDDGEAVPIEVGFMTFSDLADQLPGFDKLVLEAFDARVIAALNERRCPERVRRTFSAALLSR
ncbi:MAG: hypothetical protein M0Z92_14520 [Actinomycetota bacterium]|nr:hypothetical protein [Actinomycetota bacterium]